MANKLTGKQMAFCRAMASGTMTQSAAYREAYDADNMASASVRVEASRLLALPSITLMVETLRAGIEASIQAQGLSDRDEFWRSLERGSMTLHLQTRTN